MFYVGIRQSLWHNFDIICQKVLTKVQMIPRIMTEGKVYIQKINLQLCNDKKVQQIYKAQYFLV